jgi:hypothetical protein
MVYNPDSDQKPLRDVFSGMGLCPGCVEFLDEVDAAPIGATLERACPQCHAIWSGMVDAQSIPTRPEELTWKDALICCTALISCYGSLAAVLCFGMWLAYKLFR